MTLFDHIPDDIRTGLDREFRAETAGPGLRDALSTCDGAFAASRYPFEQDADVTRYPFELLTRCSNFLAEFAAKLGAHDRIQWR